MAEQIDVEVTGKSKYEIAHQIALNIWHAQQKKVGDDPKEYLNTVVDAIDALGGIRKE